MSRTNYGTGSLRLIGRYWHYDLMVDGERLRGSTKKTKKSDAQRELEKLIGKRVRGELTTSRSPTSLSVAGCLNDYVDQYCADLKEKTRTNYRGHADLLIAFFKDTLVSDLDSASIQAYRDSRRSAAPRTAFNAAKAPQYRGKTITSTTQRTVQSSTINRELATLRAALRETHRRYPESIKYIPYIPMDDERRRVRKGYITETQLTSFLAGLPSYLQPLVICGFYCGGRVQEWLGLNWQDIDFDAGLIYIRETKAGKPREVPIWDGLMHETLLRYKAQRDLMWPSLEAVFTYEGVQRLRVFRRSWARATEKAGLPGLIFHDLRRSANRWMRNQGIPKEVRKAIMGHATDSMDSRYGIVDLADINAAREMVNRKNKA